MDMFRKMTGIFAVSLLLLATAAGAKNVEVVPGSWVIELASPPVVEYTGDPLNVLQGGELRIGKALAATAPEVTGHSRLDMESPAAVAYVNHLDNERAAVLAEAAARLGRDLEPRHVFRIVGNGFTARLSDKEAVMLRDLPGVSRVFREPRYRIETDAGPFFIGSNMVWNGVGQVPGPNRGEGMVLGVIDTGINWESAYFSANSAGFTITNPRPTQLGLCSQASVQCNGKLIGVYDFTDEGTLGKDPNNHGSHVASTAAGNPLSFTLSFGPGINIFFGTSGVAPRANIISYKACEADPDDPGGPFGCPFGALSSALDQAVNNQVDVLNYSIGGSPISPWNSTLSQKFRNIRAAGIVAVTSAGNDGPGLSTITSPANAPWVISVGALTHDRRLTNRLVDTSGGPFNLGELTGAGATGGFGPAPIVHARDFGNALCGVGEPELQAGCQQNTGASNPFPPGTFSGQIVVCDRGEYGRVEKGRNLQLAGAGGYILANTGEFGESVNSDEHCLPAVHVGQADGDVLRDWLDSGSGHSGRISGMAREQQSDFGDRIAAFSSRGPAPTVPDLFKPDVSAPGVDILAAGAAAPGSVAFISGTSMASPHVAGAALLLRRQHPSWGADEIHSALVTTSRSGAVLDDLGNPANFMTQGAGRVRVDDAMRIGLYFRVTNQQFIAANPASGGNPGALNLPTIFAENCASQCTFTRTVTARVNGIWNVSAEGDLDISVSPSSFTLTNGQTQTLEITINAAGSNGGPEGFADGHIVLQPSSSALVTQRVPVSALVGAGVEPGLSKDIVTNSNRGSAVLEIPDLPLMPEARFNTSALTRLERTTQNLPQDPSPGNPFSGAGRFVLFVDVPADTLALYAETFESTAEDIDLYVGRDDNGDGVPQPSELRCQGITPDDLETCLIENPEPGSWWIIVQNWQASAPGASDEVSVGVAVLTSANDPSFVATGPGLHPGGPLDLPLYYDQPAMMRNERWMAAVGIASTPDELSNLGVVPVFVRRNVFQTPQDTALFQDRPTPVVLGPGFSHRRLFIDVPDSTRELNFFVETEAEVSATIRKLPFSALEGLEPGSPPAPGGSLPATVTDIPGGFQLQIRPGGGQTIEQGRYFLRLSNDGSTEALVTVTGDFIEDIRKLPNAGLWEAANRNTGQTIDWQTAAGLGYIIWYAYAEDGTPAWYVTAPIRVRDNSSVWSSALFRVNSNRARQTLDQVGEVAFTVLAREDAIFSWRINGHHGSERMAPLSDQSCKLIGDRNWHVTATWFIDGAPEGGGSLILNDSTPQYWLRHYFDDLGDPRWVRMLTDQPGASQDLDVLDPRGFCPYCQPVDLQQQLVGEASVQINNHLSGSEMLNFVAAPPIQADINTMRDLVRLSRIRGCP